MLKKMLLFKRADRQLLVKCNDVIIIALWLFYLIASKDREKKRECNEGEREREGSTKGKGGLYKKLQIPTLPPKSSRSGVTFH